MQNTVYEIALTDIRVSEANVRKHVTGIAELAASIEAVGLLQPIVLRGTYGEPPYELVIGQRRFLAHKQLGREKIRATFLDADTSELDSKVLSLTENALRVELNHADAAEAVGELYVAFDRDERKVQEATGLSLQMIRKYLAIEHRADDRMKAMLRENKVTPHDVRRCLDAAGEHTDKAVELLEIMAQQNLTAYQKKRIVEFGQAQPELVAQDIVKKAQEPRREYRLSVMLDARTLSGLNQAVEAMSMDREEIARVALEEWLRAQGYIGE